jgi:hypothetical protein
MANNIGVAKFTAKETSQRNQDHVLSQRNQDHVLSQRNQDHVLSHCNQDHVLRLANILLTALEYDF